MTDQNLIAGIAHLGIRVHDLERTRGFYEKLGFQFIIGPVGPEPVAILKHPCGVEINLILNANSKSNSNILMDVADKHPGYTHVALRITSMEAAQALLEAASIPLSGGPNQYPGGACGMFVRDPDGNVVELYQPA